MTQQSTSASATATQLVRRTQLLTYKQVAERMNACENTARKTLRELGVVPVIVGRLTRLVEHEVEAALSSLRREERSMPSALASARGLKKPKA